MDAPDDKSRPADEVRRIDVAARVDPVSSALRCPFCHDPVRLEVPTPWVACAACLARHHGSCWAESGRCGACGHDLRLRPDTRGRGALSLLGAAAAGSLLTLLVAAGLIGDRPRRTAADPAPVAPPRPLAPEAIAPGPTLPGLSHVRVGQRYVYELQGDMQQVWTVRQVGVDIVRYELSMSMGGKELGDPTLQEWRYTPPTDPIAYAPRPDVKLSHERLAVSGLLFDCMVAEAAGYRSWTTVTPGNHQVWTFPGILKTVQLSDQTVVMELVRVEQLRGEGGTTSHGYRLSGDRTEVDDGTGTWVPYAPAAHGDLPSD